MYIYSLLGMEMFANRIRFDPDGAVVIDVLSAVIEDEIIIPPRLNFDNILFSLTTVFCEIIGEDWNVAMMNQTRS